MTGSDEPGFELYTTYKGTPARPKAANARVMAGSRRVQSPFISVTPLLRKTACTALSAKALRSLTRQVMHQLSVKFTNSGRPAALSLATSAASYGCHSSAVCAGPAPPGAAATPPANRTGSPMASSRASVAVTSAAARPVPAPDLDFWYAHAAKAMRMAPANAAPRPKDEVCCASTHNNHAADA